MSKLKDKAQQLALRAIRTHDIKADRVELENRASNLDKRIIEGYAVIWGSKNGYNEIFVRGAFAKAINERGPNSAGNFKIKFRHEHRETVALFDELIEDEIGLYFRTKPLDAGELEDEILKKLKSGVFNNFSIGFRYVRGKHIWDSDNETLNVLEANLYEISVVGLPSDEATFAIRSKSENFETLINDTEKFILNLPKHMELQARYIFAIYQSLMDNEQVNQAERSLNTRNEQADEKKSQTNLDLEFIAKNLNL